jgi:hypothetical protein
VNQLRRACVRDDRHAVVAKRGRAEYELGRLMRDDDELHRQGRNRADCFDHRAAVSIRRSRVDDRHAVRPDDEAIVRDDAVILRRDRIVVADKRIHARRNRDRRGHADHRRTREPACDEHHRQDERSQAARRHFIAEV